MVLSARLSSMPYPTALTYIPHPPQFLLFDSGHKEELSCIFLLGVPQQTNSRMGS